MMMMMMMVVLPLLMMVLCRELDVHQLALAIAIVSGRQNQAALQVMQRRWGRAQRRRHACELLRRGLRRPLLLLVLLVRRQVHVKWH